MTNEEWNEQVAARERLARELGAQDYVLRTLFETLADVRATLAEHEDADAEGDPLEYIPNWEMRLMGEIDRAVDSAKLSLAEYKREKAS